MSAASAALLKIRTALATPANTTDLAICSSLAFVLETLGLAGLRSSPAVLECCRKTHSLATSDKRSLTGDRMKQVSSGVLPNDSARKAFALWAEPKLSFPESEFGIERVGVLAAVFRLRHI